MATARAENNYSLGVELEELTWVNRVQLFLMPYITEIVKRKKERQFLKTGQHQLKTNFLLFDGTPWVMSIRKNAGKAQALTNIYNFFPSWRLIDFLNPVSWLEAFWASVMNCKAVRNRYRYTKSILQSAITLSGKDHVRVLELAAGTSQALLETVASFRSKKIDVYVTLVDIDQSSLDNAMKLAESLGVSDLVTTETQNLFVYLKENRKKVNFDVVEMVGIADYLDDKQSVLVYKLSNQVLVDGGKLITSNISDNPEREFVHTVVDWPDMYYREEKVIHDFLCESGFTKPTVFKEPAMYVIGVAEK